MNKRGLSTTILVLVVVVVLVALFFGTDLFKTTGQATYTTGANYGPIEQDSQNYPDCTHLTKDDGWSVTTKATVQSFDRTSGTIKEYADNCEGDRTVREFNCQDNTRQTRLVNCPTGMVCNQGVCIYE